MTGKRIAIIGGGISGLYAARRISTLCRGAEVVLYEASQRLGGRILTVPFEIWKKKPGSDSAEELVDKLSAELGAMRFPDSHELLLKLIADLGLDNPDKGSGCSVWRGPFEFATERYHLRGHTLTSSDFKHDRVPYRLDPEERGKSPSDLVEYAVFAMLRTISSQLSKAIQREAAIDKRRELEHKHQFLNDLLPRLQRHEPLWPWEWLSLSNDYTFLGTPLRNIGFWNLLKHFLSSEAFLLVYDGFGFASVISNWNTPEAIKWVLTDFAPTRRMLAARGGFGTVIDKLASEIDGMYRLNHQLTEVSWAQGTNEQTLLPITLTFKTSGTEMVTDKVDVVILALPPHALGEIRIANLSNDEEWRRIVRSSRPHRLAKIVLAYEEPWWKYTDLPKGESGRLFTDLPMRQIYYFGPSWLAEHGWSRKHSDLSLVMVYNDSQYEAFWRTFAVHEDVYTGVGVRARDPVTSTGAESEGSEESLRNQLGWYPEDIPGSRYRLMFGKNVKDFEDLGQYNKSKFRHRIEEKVRLQLKEIHGYDVPIAIGGIHRDWAHEGGWHTWEPYVPVNEVKSILVSPFEMRNQVMQVVADPYSPLQDRMPIHVCGEAYAWEQGWIEGALMTAERIVEEICGSAHVPPSGFSKEGYEEYMYAELAAAEQERVLTSHRIRMNRTGATSSRANIAK